MCKFVCHGYSIITCLLRVKNIYRVHIWYSYKSIHSLDFRSLTHLIINIHTILLRSKSFRRGDGRRNRPAARDRTTIGSKRHQLKHNLTSSQHQSGIETTSVQKRWRHSRYADVILNMLTSFSMRWRHSRCADVISDMLMPFSFTKRPGTFLTGP